MKRFALTGGFATGKSTVGRMFEDLGIPRIDADQLTHEVTAPNQTAWREIFSAFGEEVLTSDQNLDRRKLADIIFNDPKERKRLEGIIHPRVRELMHQRIEALGKEGHTRVMLEIPLLFEAKWDVDEPLDAILVVTADEATRLDRAKRKFGLDKEAIEARVRAQLPLADKIKKATYVIENNKGPEDLRAQVESIFKKLPV